MPTKRKPPKRSLAVLRQVISDCELCPRLRRHCQSVAEKKRRAYLDWTYWGRPVPGFGPAGARLWIVGLAPAAHGANRTGRMFTGDSSGDWLYRALYETGFANQPHSTDLADGLRLSDAYVSSAVRCAPPDNKPSRQEIQTCAPYLVEEFALLRRKRAILALGNIAFQAVLRLLLERGYDLPRPRPKFVHQGVFPIGDLNILSSYHPSRQNTQTGRLTRRMWHEVFRLARQLLDERR